MEAADEKKGKVAQLEKPRVQGVIEVKEEKEAAYQAKKGWRGIQYELGWSMVAARYRLPTGTLASSSVSLNLGTDCTFITIALADSDLWQTNCFVCLVPFGVAQWQLSVPGILT